MNAKSLSTNSWTSLCIPKQKVKCFGVFVKFAVCLSLQLEHMAGQHQGIPGRVTHSCVGYTHMHHFQGVSGQILPGPNITPNTLISGTLFYMNTTLVGGCLHHHVLHYTALHCTALHCTALHFTHLTLNIQKVQKLPAGGKYNFTELVLNFIKFPTL